MIVHLCHLTTLCTKTPNNLWNGIYNSILCAKMLCAHIVNITVYIFYTSPYYCVKSSHVAFLKTKICATIFLANILCATKQCAIIPFPFTTQRSMTSSVKGDTSKARLFSHARLKRLSNAFIEFGHIKRRIVLHKNTDTQKCAEHQGVFCADAFSFISNYVHIGFSKLNRIST